MKKLPAILVFFLCITLFPSGIFAEQPQEVSEKSEYHYVFVHGLRGWGSYDRNYRFMPYWGMLGGDLMRYLNREGYDSCAASVAPEGSAWDRACELYAQLTGTVTDYGKAHSERFGHERFGRDFSSEPLIPDWNDGRKIVLLGHSFGGATIRLFSELLENGSAEEREATEPDDLSGFFKGGQGAHIHALVTLAAPTNGTTAYDMNEGSVPQEDTAAFDMYIDNALALNERISLLPDVYYFAVPCSATTETADGFQAPVKAMMERMFLDTSEAMGRFTGTTKGGFVIDETWLENDGLVNTVSSMAPLGAPQAAFDPDTAEPAGVEPGLWNVFPVYAGDHMSLQGGMTKLNNIRPFYTELLGIIERLPAA